MLFICLPLRCFRGALHIICLPLPCFRGTYVLFICLPLHCVSGALCMIYLPVTVFQRHLHIILLALTWFQTCFTHYFIACMHIVLVLLLCLFSFFAQQHWRLAAFFPFVPWACSPPPSPLPLVWVSFGELFYDAYFSFVPWVCFPPASPPPPPPPLWFRSFGNFSMMHASLPHPRPPAPPPPTISIESIDWGKFLVSCKVLPLSSFFKSGTFVSLESFT